jgi:hypothetical protein
MTIPTNRGESAEVIDPIIAAINRYNRAELAAIRAEDAGDERARQQAKTLATAAFQAVKSRPAPTPAGTLAKLRLQLQWLRDAGVDAPLLESAIADLERLAKGAAPR